MTTIPMILALAATAAVALANANGVGRARQAEAALRRVVEAQRFAMWANEVATAEVYERAANDRDDAIDAAGELLAGRE